MQHIDVAIASELQNVNVNPKDDVRPRLVPKSRIGNNAHASLARDIYDLFMYICGAQNVFPRNILRMWIECG